MEKRVRAYVLWFPIERRERTQNQKDTARFLAKAEEARKAAEEKRLNELRLIRRLLRKIGVAVSAEVLCTVGLRSDGTVVAVGYNGSGQCGVSRWRLFESVDQLKDAADRREKAEAARLEAARKKREALLAEQTDLKTELFSLKGLFTGKRRKEIEARLAEIEWKLWKLRNL